MPYRCALVVDGVRSSRLRAVTLLRLAGFRVHEASGVREALLRAAQHRPALVVADPVFPDGDGLELLRELRRNGSEADFLVVAAHPTQQLRTRAFEAGASACVPKPLDAADLVTFLRGPTTGRAAQEATTADWVVQQQALLVNSVRADRWGQRSQARIHETYALPLPHRFSPVGGDAARRAVMHDSRV